MLVRRRPVCCLNSLRLRSGEERVGAETSPRGDGPPHHRPSERISAGCPAAATADRRTPHADQRAYFQHRSRSKTGTMKTPALLTFVRPHWRSVVAVVAPLALMPLPIVSPTPVSTKITPIIFFTIFWHILKGRRNAIVQKLIL